MKIVISEEQYNRLVMEYYDSEKVYPMDYIVNRLKDAPREIKKYIKTLPSLEYEDNEGNVKIFTKIPEIVYVYISGRY